MVLGGEMNEKVSGVRVLVCKGVNKGVIQHSPLQSIAPGKMQVLEDIG